MPPIYDGSECTYCEGDAGAKHGFDEETPCDECGWYRRRSDGFRYPSTLPEVKAFTASTWQLALNKVGQIQEDFPELSKGSIVGAVEVVGVDDDEYGTEARAVLAKSVRDKRVEAEFPDIRRDLIGMIGAMLDLTPKGEEYEDALREIMSGVMMRRRERESEGPHDDESLFNKNFDLEFEEMTIDMHQRVLGCFHCQSKSATQRCTKCLVAVYCNRKCQAADWKDKSRPHKQVCSAYCDNRKPIPGQDGGMKQPFPIGLYSIGVVRYDFLLEKLMEKRTDLFLEAAALAFDKEETPSAISTGRHPMGMQFSVVHNLDHSRVQASVSLVVGWQKLDVPFVIFKVVDEGYRLQRMIHPPHGGPGDIPGEVRAKVVETLKDFLSKAKEKNIEIISLTCGRGCMWMADEESKDLLKDANGGEPLMVMPSMDYAMSGAMNAATEEACRQS